jgi:hypothetical protein
MIFENAYTSSFCAIGKEMREVTAGDFICGAPQRQK